ncbi:MAG TPA: type II secretion system secretin GspD [Deferrisomatales bacterium]|nr:type II secretion system secretin GspD [Deferrisomatales bacterium]
MTYARWTAHLLLVWLIATLPAFAVGAEDTRQITMNFKDAELEAVVQFISELTGENFILDDKVKGKVTVISPSKLSPEEAYQVFQAILNVKGFTIVQAGRVNKIVLTRDAKQSSIETVREPTDPGDRFVTHILPLTYVDAEAIASTLSPLVSKDSSVVAYAATNTLILTDAYSNIERLVDIISSLDVETVDTVLEIIRLTYASAEVMAKNVSQIVTEKGRTARRRAPARGQANVQVQGETVAVKIIADSRTNSLVVISDPDTMAEVKTMVLALDVEMPSGSGKINVYYLKYADAENVASVLTSISKSAGTKTRPGQAPAAKAPTQAAVPVEFEEPVQITADKATNSLVIIASPQDYEILSSVIEKLDVRRPQVLVEALIVEMSYEKSLELGVEWRTVDDPTGGNLSGFANQTFGVGLNSVAASGPLAAPGGLSLGLVKGVIQFGGVEFLNIGAMINALQTSGDVNVLSTPSLLTTDNEESEIVVSDNIPFKTSEKFDSNGNPISTFEYRDVGLTLRFTPQINEDDFVKLKLYQEISQVLSTATGGSTNAPSTTRRTAQTTVVAQSGSTIVIGGLIKDDTETTTSSVPCLGDLPLVGYLFRSTSDKVTKKNLLLFLTPHIINDTQDIESLTRKRRERFEGRMDRETGEPRSSAEKLQEYIDESGASRGSEGRPSVPGEKQ